MENRHEREYYTCKRLRMLSWLKNRGFMPYEVIPDVNNPKFNCWLFKNTPELQQAVTEYFNK